MTSSLVEAIPDAPKDSVNYGRINGTWASIDDLIDAALLPLLGTIRDGIQDLAAAKALDTTSATDFPDKILMLIEDLGAIFRLDRDSSTAGDDVDIIEPTTGLGRWIRTTVHDHNSLQNLNSGDFLHLTAVEKAAIAINASAGAGSIDIGADSKTTLKGLTINQQGQTVGNGLRFLDFSGNNRIADIYVNGSGQLVLQNDAGGADDILLASSTVFSFSSRHQDGIPAVFGDGFDYSWVFNPSTGELELVDGSTVGANIRIAVDSAGKVSIGKGLHLNGAVGSLTRGLIFGDGDTAIFESIDDTLVFHLSNSDRYIMTLNNIASVTDTGFSLRRNSELASPAYAFKGDLNTGMHTPGLEIVALVANGTEGLRVIADGSMLWAAVKAGTDQSDAGAAANEPWRDTSDGNTLKLGV